MTILGIVGGIAPGTHGLEIPLLDTTKLHVDDALARMLGHGA